MDIGPSPRHHRHRVTHSPQIMGILNTTPDSFSDGGAYIEPDTAVARAQDLVREGAHYIDIGGESTRPGATPIDLETEISRTMPAVAAVAALGVPVVSIDTTKAEVARQAIILGAQMVNDVSGGFADAIMLSMVADTDVDLVLGHWRRYLPATIREDNATSQVKSIIAEMSRIIDHALAAGVGSSRLMIDPGIGLQQEPGNMLAPTHITRRDWPTRVPHRARL